eukprot:TRINITY_DN4018_c0_g2_i1.p1 TRINITY_DN4018_c0_g2~~TRINITY_DN4018_c0_g2_i1.p1  ORF type:complete len:296 (-),score=120.67 TRINITY_DN4018_c0_g2_i1:16-903(-)
MSKDSERSDNIKKKRSKFAWLARFLGLRYQIKDTKTIAGPPGASSSSSSSSSAPKQNVFFGVNPEKIYREDTTLVNNIPKPLWYCAEALEPWMIIEGVFRVSGIFSEMARMKQTFEDGNIPDFAKVDSKHSISGLLELWFRELPEPVTTHALYNDFMLIVEGEFDDNKRLETAKQVVERLPAPNATVLSFFLRVLKKVAALEHENKMGPHNLGVVFGSILLGSDILQFTLAMKQRLNNQSSVVEYLIRHVQYLFPSDDDPVEDATTSSSSSSSSSAPPPPSDDAEDGAVDNDADE